MPVWLLPLATTSLAGDPEEEVAENVTAVLTPAVVTTTVFTPGVGPKVRRAEALPCASLRIGAAVVIVPPPASTAKFTPRPGTGNPVSLRTWTTNGWANALLTQPLSPSPETTRIDPATFGEAVAVNVSGLLL